MLEILETVFFGVIMGLLILAGVVLGLVVIYAIICGVIIGAKAIKEERKNGRD